MAHLAHATCRVRSTLQVYANRSVKYASFNHYTETLTVYLQLIKFLIRNKGIKNGEGGAKDKEK